MLRRSCSYATRARLLLAVPIRNTIGKRYASVLSTSQINVPCTKTTVASLPVYTISRRYASYPPHIKLGMPALSPTMTQGNIVSWSKKVGDKVKAGDEIAAIETDKATLPLEMTEDGFIAKILVPEGTKDVPVNKPIAILVTKKDDIAKFESFKDEGSSEKAPEKSSDKGSEKSSQGSDKASQGEKRSPSQAPPEASKSSKSTSSSSSSSSKPQQQSKPSSPSKSYPPHTVVGLPSLSPSMERGNIVSWNKKEGDKIKAGDSIAQIETDKSTMDFETTDDGFLAKIILPAKSTDIPLGTPIAIIVNKQADVAAFKDYTPEQKQSGQQSHETESNQEKESQEEQGQEKEQGQQQQEKPQRASGERVFASPLAKSLGRQHNIDVSQIRGTGPSNRVIRDDVLEFVAQQKEKPAEKEKPAPTQDAKPSKAPAAQQAASDSYTDLPLSNIRKVTAERLLHSKQTIPHYYLTMDVRMDKLLKLRTELNDQSNGKYKLSVNDFIIKASAFALQKVPVVNSSWNDKFIRRYNNIDINVAVNTDQGLFTPIVQNADKRGLSDIANAVKILADKAKQGKLSPSEFQGGTFTISNLGMFGIKHFSAVINPPQAAILAVGGAQQRLVPVEGKGENATEVATVMAVTLSCDHRVVDGAVGAEWLQAFKEVMENPLKLLL